MCSKRWFRTAGSAVMGMGGMNWRSRSWHSHSSRSRSEQGHVNISTASMVGAKSLPSRI